MRVGRGCCASEERAAASGVLGRALVLASAAAGRREGVQRAAEGGRWQWAPAARGRGEVVPWQRAAGSGQRTAGSEQEGDGRTGNECEMQSDAAPPSRSWERCRTMRDVQLPVRVRRSTHGALRSDLQQHTLAHALHAGCAPLRYASCCVLLPCLPCPALLCPVALLSCCPASHYPAVTSCDQLCPAALLPCSPVPRTTTCAIHGGKLHGAILVRAASRLAPHSHTARIPSSLLPTSPVRAPMPCGFVAAPDTLTP